MIPVVLALALTLPADHHKPVAPSVKVAWCHAFHAEPKVWRPYVAYMRDWCKP